MLNHNKTRVLVVSRSKTVNPPHGDLVLSGVSIRVSSNFDILGGKFHSKISFEDYVRGMVSRVSQRICNLRLVKRIFVDTSVLLRCYYALVLPILAYCSPVCGSASECHLQLLERQVCSVARLCHDQSFLSFCQRRYVAGLCMLYMVYSNSNPVCSASFLLFLPEFDIREQRPEFIHWSLKYQCVERPNLQGVSCQTMFECGRTLNTLCLIPERWKGSRVQSTLIPELCFLEIFLAKVLVGLRKQFIKQFCFY